MTEIYAGTRWSDGTAYTKSSLAAALAVATSGDVVLVECFDAARSLIHTVEGGNVPDGVTVMQSPNIPWPRGVVLKSTLWGLAAVGEGAIIDGFTLHAASQMVGDYNRASLYEFTIRNCVLLGNQIHYPSYKSRCVFQNCQIMCQYAGFNLDPTNRQVYLDNCTLVGTLNAINSSTRLRNCLCLCVGTPGTPLAGTDTNKGFCATFGTNFTALTGRDYSPVADFVSLNDYRLLPGSSLATGAADIGLTADIDGNSYAGGFPFGCSQGVANLAPSLRLVAADGTYQPVATNDVRTGTAVGVSPAVGTCAVPGAADVRLGVSVDATVGTFVSFVNVLDFDAIHWDLADDILTLIDPPKDINYPVITDVAYPVVYGFDDQFTGTLVAGFPPRPPVLTVEDLGSGVARFTITGSTPTTTNQVYIRATTTAAWGASPVVTISADGSATATLDAGPYLAKVQSHLDGAVSAASNEPVLFHLQDAASGYVRSDFGDEFKDGILPELMTAFGEMVTYLRGVQSVELAAIEGDAIMVNDADTGADIQLGTASWEVSADDLDFGSGPIVPRANDQIITTKNEVYIVVEAGVLDSEQIMWTIPVKRSDYKELP